MTRNELQSHWRSREKEYERLHVHVDGAKIIAEFLTDLNRCFEDESDEILSLTKAAQLSAYSPAHLSRLIRQGKLPNAGRRNAPKLRRADIPRKATALPHGSQPAKLTKAQIARSIIHRSS